MKIRPLTFGSATRLLTAILALTSCLGAVHLGAAENATGVQGKKILFVVQLTSKSRPVDEQIKKHLESMGFAVTFADQTDPASKADGQDLVVISSTISAHVLLGAYKDTTLPVVTWECNILPEMGMTGKKIHKDWDTLEKEHYLTITNAPHPLAAGFPAGTVVVSNKDIPMSWGKPGLGAAIIATQRGYPEKATIFAYEKGATMDYDHVAPARRVSFFLDNETFKDLTPAGVKLFDAAILWAVAQPGT